MPFFRTNVAFGTGASALAPLESHQNAGFWDECCAFSRLYPKQKEENATFDGISGISARNQKQGRRRNAPSTRERRIMAHAATAARNDRRPLA